MTPLLVALTGCESLPGERKQQGAVIGGAAGAATGAAVAKNHRALGAVLGGLLGAGGGYVIAAKTDKVKNQDQEAAAGAMHKAKENPATAEDARKAMTADLNNDGFVTLDEVVAMKSASLSDEQMIERMKATDQIFELTADQEKYLRDHGVSQEVVTQMAQINKNKRPILSNEKGDVISRPPPAP
ncbi:MAG: glycine zipper domain-containing protein [Verrucomicrobiota bacterium]|nr:glycine zipper domain-containing protein [Verrucomicrobiota bacterium]